MSRHAKGPRLYLRRGRTDARTRRALPDLYYIRDGARERGTGCGPDGLPGAEQALAAYIAEKWTPPQRAAGGQGDPADVLVAEVLTLYARERAPQLADPVSSAGRIRALLAWWGARPVADVKRSTCQAYVAHRVRQPRAAARTDAARQRCVTAQGARRELEDLSAAIGYWDGEHKLSPRPIVWLPPKAAGPRGALTRAQAAALLKAARGYRQGPDGAWTAIPGRARTGRAHVARFILIGLYTGSRAGVITRLLWEESPRDPWADLDAGVIYRRGRAEAESRTKRRPLVKIPRRLAAHLARWARRDAAWRARLVAAAKAAGEEFHPPMTVLHHGARPIAGKVRKAFAAVVADAGLDAAITPHWLRHTCATWLMEAGVPIWDAAGFTGMTTATLEAHYGHHRPDHQGTARKALG
jgi:integrase